MKFKYLALASMLTFALFSDSEQVVDIPQTTPVDPQSYNYNSVTFKFGIPAVGFGHRSVDIKKLRGIDYSVNLVLPFCLLGKVSYLGYTASDDLSYQGVSLLAGPATFGFAGDLQYVWGAEKNDGGYWEYSISGGAIASTVLSGIILITEDDPSIKGLARGGALVAPTQILTYTTTF